MSLKWSNNRSIFLLSKSCLNNVLVLFNIVILCSLWAIRSRVWVTYWQRLFVVNKSSTRLCLIWSDVVRIVHKCMASIRLVVFLAFHTHKSGQIAFFVLIAANQRRHYHSFLLLSHLNSQSYTPASKNVLLAV